MQPIELSTIPYTDSRHELGEWIAHRLLQARNRDIEWRGDEPAPENIPVQGRVPAAVLVPIVIREREVNVLLTRRTDHLEDHAGQISFPGGRSEPRDLSREATALREAEEEIGLPAERVEVLGTLAEYHTVTGFDVTPVVGMIEPPLDLRLDPFEVAEVFEVPFSFLMDPANHQRHTRIFRERQRSYWAIPYKDRYIWGATAGMLRAFYEALHAQPGL